MARVSVILMKNVIVPESRRIIRMEKQTWKQQISLVVRLSIPAILAEISSIIMQYIDAAMVGSLGADASAAIGLITSS